MSSYLGFTHDLLGSSKGLGHFSSSTLYRHTARLLGSSWFHSTAAAVLGSVITSPKSWGLLLQPGCTFTNSLLGSLHGARPQLLCTIPSFLAHQLPLRLYLHQWWLLASHRAKPWLLSTTPLSLQNQYHPGDSYTISVSVRVVYLSCQLEVQLSGTQLLCADPEETLPRFHLNGAGLFLIAADSSANHNERISIRNSK